MKLRERDGIIATLVGLAALVLYGMTVQRGLSFWDCGEFIACSAILGIPHPPGSPLFVLWGRLFSTLPWPADIGFRINLVSVLFGAASVMMAYLLVARLVRRHLLDDATLYAREWMVFVCGVCGAFTAGFGATVWSNSTEAEVYGLTLFLFFAILYLAAVWYDRRSTVAGPRLLVLATFLAGLGLGLHMMVYLALPGLWLTVFVVDPALRKDWRVWATAFATVTIMFTGVEAHLAALGLLLLLGMFARARWGTRPGGVLLQLIFAAALLGLWVMWSKDASTPPSSGPALWSWVDWVALGLLSAVALVGAWIERDTKHSFSPWRLPMALSGAALLAFSLLLFIPIRSAHDPAIDENDPQTWSQVRGFLERKQYGRESMIERMFTRRGEWSNQLGRHERMGFWSFFETQYGLKSGDVEATGVQRYSFLVLFLLGIGGAASLVWRSPRVGIPILLVLLLCTVGLVVYMNFADGTRYKADRADQAYLEVRDRDYFFTTGFALFGVCLGLGVAAFFRAFRSPRGKLTSVVCWVASAVFLFALPWKTVEANYWTHDRSRDSVAEDYAYNFLQSCQPGGLLFTNGDNDTFPLWALQEAYGVRRDVQIVNLSLANTFWYIRQAKSRGVPMTIKYDDIESLRPEARRGRIQDQVLASVLDSNRYNRDVYFGASTPQGSRIYHGRSLDSLLVMEGLVMRLGDDLGFRQADAALIWSRFQGTYRLSGLSDTTIYYDVATKRIADNYATSLLFVADRYRRQGQVDSALAASTLASRLRPGLSAARNYLVQLAGEFNRTQVLDSVSAGQPPQVQAALNYQFGLAAEHAQDTLRASASYKRSLALDPSQNSAFQRLAGLQFQAKQWDSLLALVDRWVAANPDDTTGPKLRAEVLRYKETDSTSGMP